MAIIQFHFDGPITQYFDGETNKEHIITLRTLSRTLIHLQSAADRANLDIKYGHVWKHARPKREDYAAADFIVGEPREGGYILDLISDSANEIVRRISSAVGTVEQKNEADETLESERLPQQADDRRSGTQQAMDFSDYLVSKDDSLTTSFSVRSIAKEIDQTLIPIRKMAGNNTIEFTFTGEDFKTVFKYDKETAKAFHKKIARRDLGTPLWIPGSIRELDGGDQFSPPKGKFKDAITKRVHTLHIESEEQYNLLVPYMRKQQGEAQQIFILACPVHEFGAFDPNGGDLYFLGTVDETRTVANDLNFNHDFDIEDEDLDIDEDS